MVAAADSVHTVCFPFRATFDLSAHLPFRHPAFPPALHTAHRLPDCIAPARDSISRALTISDSQLLLRPFIRVALLGDIKSFSFFRVISSLTSLTFHVRV